MITFKVYIKEKTNIDSGELKKGDKVTNCNKDCKHFKSGGIVTSVKKIKGKKGNTVGNKIEYKCANSGKNWKKNDKLEKTEIQLKKV